MSMLTRVADVGVLVGAGFLGWMCHELIHVGTAEVLGYNASMDAVYVETTWSPESNPWDTRMITGMPLVVGLLALLVWVFANGPYPNQWGFWPMASFWFFLVWGGGITGDLKSILTGRAEFDTD